MKSQLQTPEILPIIAEFLMALEKTYTKHPSILKGPFVLTVLDMVSNQGLIVLPSLQKLYTEGN